LVSSSSLALPTPPRRAPPGCCSRDLQVSERVDAVLGRGPKDLERAHERRVDGHNRGCVVELATVVGRREERDEPPVGEELVAVLDDLMRRWRLHGGYMNYEKNSQPRPDDTAERANGDEW